MLDFDDALLFLNRGLQKSKRKLVLPGLTSMRIGTLLIGDA